MQATDSFTQHYYEHLEGEYECPDRIVMSGFFRFGHRAAGFRLWWRSLYGSDEKLNNNHLMRISGHFSRRLRAAMKQRGVEVRYLTNDDRAHEIAEAHIPSDPDFRGVFLVTIKRSPGRVFDVELTSDGRIRNIKWKEPLPYINHYSFHIIDPEWGHVTFKICGQPPFATQIIFNGHEYIERQARKQGLVFTKDGNCFTEVSNPAALAEIAETLRSPSAEGQLVKVCDRWIYSACLCFALNMEDQRRSGFRYDFTLFQVEYSRNLLFRHGRSMDQIFQSIIDRIRGPMNIRLLRTIFGHKRRPYRLKKKPPKLQSVVKRPVYDMTVFKVDFYPFTLKIYTKGERVLRVEVILHNSRRVPGRRTIPKLHEAIDYLHGVLDRFLDVVDCIHTSFIGADQLDALRTHSQVGKTRVGGVDLENPRLRSVAEAVISLAPKPGGFKVSELAAEVRKLTGWDDERYKPTQAAYDLKKLRGKGLVTRIGKSHRYETKLQGIRVLAAYTTLRDKVIHPILAGTNAPSKQGRKPSPIDKRYINIQKELRQLFKIIGIAA